MTEYLLYVNEAELLFRQLRDEDTDLDKLVAHIARVNRDRPYDFKVMRAFVNQNEITEMQMYEPTLDVCYQCGIPIEGTIYTPEDVGDEVQDYCEGCYEELKAEGNW